MKLLATAFATLFFAAASDGLTREQAAEVVTHLAFYTGWPKAMSAVPVLKEVFTSLGTQG